MKQTQEYATTNRLPDDQMSSRFRSSKILTDENGNVFFETYYVRDIPYGDRDSYHEVTPGEEGRLDLISFIYYGTPLLWWVIAEANDIVSPLKDIYAGLVLRIPDQTVIFRMK